MNERHQSSSAVLASIRERLASARKTKPAEILDTIVTALTEGRGYAWTGIYLAVENLGVREASSGHNAGPASMSLEEVSAEIAVPIRLGARTIGLIVAETGRTLSSTRLAARQERVLLQQTAKLIAQYLTTDRAKQLLRKTREKARETAAVQPHKTPQSARPTVRRAAAGERLPR